MLFETYRASVDAFVAANRENILQPVRWHTLLIYGTAVHHLLTFLPLTFTIMDSRIGLPNTICTTIRFSFQKSDWQTMMV